LGLKGLNRPKEEKMKENWEELPQTFNTSAEKRMGQDELLTYIRQIKEAAIGF